MERKPRILAAVRPQGGVAVLRALGEYAEVVPVYEYDDAVAALTCCASCVRSSPRCPSSPAASASGPCRR